VVNNLHPSLNKSQKDAVEFGDGPLLIIAGAGTGKTTVVTERIKHLIVKGHAKANEILALTFTEKAAREMEERVDIAMPYGYTQMWIMTFHSFCDRILRREALHIGLEPNFKLMSEAEAIQLLRKHIFNLNLKYFRPLGNPNKFLSGMLTHFSRLQDEDISPSDYAGWVKKQKGKTPEEKLEIAKWKELSSVYRAYDEFKVKDGLMDYGDLIVKTLKVFRDRPNILKEYKKQFKYFLVDEFQDTNYAQNELVKLLAGVSGNVTVVGDDDQSVYKFRGAAVSNIIQFRANYPKTKIIVLTKNYRSTQEILDRSYDLIRFNNPDRLEVVEKIDKRLTAENAKQGDEVELLMSDRVENEADGMAKKILQLNKENSFKWMDFAILIRANNHSEPIMRALQRHGIPFQFLGPGRLFRQAEIIDLISYLKVLYNYEDSNAFYRILSNDHWDIAGRDIAAIGNFARKYNLSLFEAAENIDKIQVSQKSLDAVNNITGIIKKHLGRVKKDSAGQLLYYYLEETGLLTELLSPESVDAEKKAQNISKFFDKLKSYETDHPEATVFSVVDYLDLSLELGESPMASDSDWNAVNAVNILTIHSAKGLEFPVVFMANLVSQRFPTIERREQIPIPEGLIKEVLPVGDYHVQEERRLFYVGMTRAKQKLYFTAANFYGEGKREKKISPFVYEALGKRIKDKTAESVKTKQLTFLDYKPVEELSSAVIEIPSFKIDYLSVSQIETFQICPLHYKLKYIYKLPSEPTAPLSFGVSIHCVMRDFYGEIKSGKKPTEKLLLDLLDKEWIKVGYKNKLQEKGYLNTGRGYVKSYYKNIFDKKDNPILLEEKFNFKLGNLKIGGTFDRVDLLPDGRIEIIDYKTGEKIPTQKEVDRDMQLGVYALAATKIDSDIFRKKPEEIKLSLYYFHTAQKITTTRTAKDLEKLEKELFEIREKIEKSDFGCSNHMFCQNGCEFGLFCKSDAD
jgi:DNA helicase-2/ATP-dependent DNA helicase PcrA